MDGIIIVDKPKDYTSRDIVNIISKKLKTKKVGHTGTLDPLATGVLVVCIGKATKLVDVLSSPKEYIAEVTLGIETDTLDITGKILKEENTYISKEKIENALKQMTTTYDQEVPIYSAVKVNGKKLYEYARKNEQVNLPKKLVTIYNLSLIGDIKYENNKTIFKIKCSVSKGTYIRALIRDLALKLNTIGVMSNLRRTENNNFRIDEAYTIEDIDNDNYKILPIKSALTDYTNIIVDEKQEFKIKNGQILDNIYNKDIVVFLNKNEEVLAIYKNDNGKLKVYKML